MSIELVGALSAATAAVALVLGLSTRDVTAPHVHLPHPDAAALLDAGWTRGLRRWEAVRVACVLTTLVTAGALGIPIAIVSLAAVTPSIWIRLRAEAAQDRARRALARILASTESALRSGLSLPDALRRGTEASADPLASRPLLEALRAFGLGAGLDAALTTAAHACRDDRARVAIGSLSVGIAERLPRERLADMLASVADRAAFEERLDDEVRARASGARQQQRLLAALVPALALYLTFTMPTLAVTLGSDLGRFVLIPAAAALEVAGIVMGRRVVRQALR